MTRQDVVKILMIITSAFPNFKSDNMSNTADVWTTLLDGYEYKDIQAALVTYISSNNSGFAPSVSQLIAGARKITREEPDYQNEEEAWSLVYKAICKSTYYSVEEFNKLPAICQKAIGSPDNLRELATSDLDAIQSVEKSNFMRVYRAELAKQIEIDKIPQQIKAEYQLESRQKVLLEVRPEPTYQTRAKENATIDFSELVNKTIKELDGLF